MTFYQIWAVGLVYFQVLDGISQTETLVLWTLENGQPLHESGHPAEGYETIHELAGQLWAAGARPTQGAGDTGLQPSQGARPQIQGMGERVLYKRSYRSRTTDLHYMYEKVIW